MILNISEDTFYAAHCALVMLSNSETESERYREWFRAACDNLTREYRRWYDDEANLGYAAPKLSDATGPPQDYDG